MPASARPHLALSIAVLATVALLSGCGGGGGDGGTLTKAEVIAQGNEICRQGDQQYTELQKNPPKTSEERGDSDREADRDHQREVDQIARTRTPRPRFGRRSSATSRREQTALAILEQGLKAAREQRRPGPTPRPRPRWPPGRWIG